jgi:hypothetical protein
MYEDVVNQKCHYCEATISGNQQYMLGGKNLPSKRGGRIPNWIKQKPEHKWIWNGLSEYIEDKRVSFEFYLCPLHCSSEDIQNAFKWAQGEINKVKKE